MASLRRHVPTGGNRDAGAACQVCSHVLAGANARSGEPCPHAPAARPAVEVAARSDDPVIRREAIHMLGFFNRAPFLSAAPTPRGSLWRRGLSGLFRRPTSSGPKILILTPVKDAADCIPSYRERL